MPLRPFSYQEGFEEEGPTLGLWAKNGPSTVAFSRPTDERAFEGKRSYKLDVTLDGGSYHYFGAPVRVPCEGAVTLSARVLVAEGTTARVGFGTNMVYPRTHHSGCGAVKSFDGPTDGWQLIEIDLVERANAGKAKVMAGQTADTRGEDVGAYLDRWSLFIYGGEGRRAVVYLDDVRVSGEVPTEEDYAEELDRRWSNRQARLQKQVVAWRTTLAEARAGMVDMPEPAESVKEDAEAIVASIDRAEQLINQYAEAGYGSNDAVQAIEAALFISKYGPETIRAITEGVAAGLPYLVYTPPAITDRQFVLDVSPIPSRVSRKLACSGCRGEYESATVVVYALEALQGMLVSVSDLTGPGGLIPADAVDIHTVKCWYQAGREISPNQKVFMPELLLKDAALVRVDRQAEQNYLRSTAEDGTHTYLLCSGKTSDNLKDVRPVDAAILQPVDIPARTLQQFWLTVHIPENAAPGTYTSEVTFATSGGKRALPFEVTVHAFDLLPSRLTYSIYYRAKLAEDGWPTIGSEYKSEEQYRAEIEDMFAHGVAYPTNYHGMDPPRLRRILEVRRDAGLPTGRFYTLGRTTGSPGNAGELEQLKTDVRQWIEFCRPFGYEDVYFYGIDEARGDRLKAQRAAWRAVREAGGKSFVACYLKTFEAMGDLLDCAVLASRPNPDEAQKYHGVGSEAFCYAYPQVGNSGPETYRRNFGLVLWKAGFDGAMDYAYQHGFNHVWNDFDSASYCDHNFAYPTVNGVVDTIQWEGFREAVDDVRYITTLEHAIANAPTTKSNTAQAAQTWLNALDPDAINLDTARAQMVDLIAQLR